MAPPSYSLLSLACLAATPALAPAASNANHAGIFNQEEDRQPRGLWRLIRSLTSSSRGTELESSCAADDNASFSGSATGTSECLASHSGGLTLDKAMVGLDEPTERKEDQQQQQQQLTLPACPEGEELRLSKSREAQAGLHLPRLALAMVEEPPVAQEEVPNLPELTLPLALCFSLLPALLYSTLLDSSPFLSPSPAAHEDSSLLLP